jgi:hypothetical protein
LDLEEISTKGLVDLHCSISNSAFPIQHLQPGLQALRLGMSLQSLKREIPYGEAADQEYKIISYLPHYTREIGDIVSCHIRLKGTETSRSRNQGYLCFSIAEAR